jgi:hypothetical protein
MIRKSYNDITGAGVRAEQGDPPNESENRPVRLDQFFSTVSNSLLRV